MDADGEYLQVPKRESKSLWKSKSLWDQAYDDLRKEHRELVESFEQMLMSEPEMGESTVLEGEDTSKREEQMSALVESKLKAMNEKQWRFKVCGRVVEVRERVDRIVKVVLVAKESISSAAYIDPLHAGIPWAGVCMLLPVSDLGILDVLYGS